MSKWHIIFVLLCTSNVAIATNYAGGNGTKEHPYEIATADQLALLGSLPGDYDKHFIVVNDIDFSKQEAFRDSVIAAQVLVQNHGTFRGHFDGQGYAIENLRIETESNSYIGLFGEVGNGGRVTNVFLINAQVKGKNYVGGLVGKNSGAVSNCGNMGAEAQSHGHMIYRSSGVMSVVVGSDFIKAGMTGNDMEATAHLQAYDPGTGNYIGGLVGLNEGTIANCFSEASVRGYGDVGGLVGWNSGGDISYSYYSANQDKKVKGIKNVGGVVGRNSDDGQSNTGIVINCFAQGQVEPFSTEVRGGPVNTAQLGGLVGTNEGGSIEHSYCACQVSNAIDVKVWRMVWEGNTGRHKWDYDRTEHVPAGALVSSSSGQINGCFWDRDVCGLPGAGGTGKSTVEMQSESTFLEANWRFWSNSDSGDGALWTIGPREYPSFIWNTIPYLGEGTQDDPYLIRNDKEFGLLKELSGYLCSYNYVLEHDCDLSSLGWPFRNRANFEMPFEGNGTQEDPYIIRKQYQLSNLEHFCESQWGYFFLVVDCSCEIDLSTVTPELQKQISYHSFFEQGIGTLENPYVIKEAYQLESLIMYCHDQWNSYFRLDADIKDLGELRGCLGTEDLPFSGGFDGNGHQLSFSSGSGLFGVVNGGEIRNLYINNAQVNSSSSRVGLLVDYLRSGILASCYARRSEVRVTSGGLDIGGLVGLIEKGLISDCYTDVEVVGGTNAGGIVGRTIEGRIQRCYCTGPVAGFLGNSTIGGIVGNSSSSELVMDCYYDEESCGKSPFGFGMPAFALRGRDGQARLEQDAFLSWDFSGISDGPCDHWAWRMGTVSMHNPLLWCQDGAVKGGTDAWFSGGRANGSPDYPYLIATANELNSIGDNPRLMSKCFELAGDILLAGFNEENLYLIGSEAYPFRGQFDGKGHRITNLSYHGTQDEIVGMFRFVDGGSISNVVLSGVDLAGDPNKTGALIGCLKSGTQHNCTLEGNNLGLSLIGGIPAADYPNIVRIIDDFESYDDTPPNRIYVAWLDGLGYTQPEPGYIGNGTGSIVGYDIPPFTENVIVHNGVQSMPFIYNNTIPPFISETSREFVNAENWIDPSYKSIQLWWYGERRNITSRVDFLYFGIEDNRGIQAFVEWSGSAGQFREEEWHKWLIDLSSFVGPDQSQVKRLYIGVGHKNNPSEGGHGIIYFDDIGISSNASH